MRLPPNFAAIYLFFNFLNFGNGESLGPCPEKVGTCTVGLSGSGSPNFIGCLPYSHNYLTASYFDNHNGLLDSDFHDFLTRNIGTGDLCKGIINHINEIELSDLNRYLIGEGSHRHLVSQMKFDRQSNELKWLNDHFCETIIIERLPIGVFADPFELQHLVERKAVFSAAAVFGDTNLELPSALSNRSIVEIHMDIGIASKSSKTVVQLPLHARYLPLDTSGYAQVAIGKPDLFLRCRPNNLRNETCSWAICNLDAGTNSVMWRIPCGNGALTGIVSSVTFVSALVCSLLIVYSVICFSRKDNIKRL